MAGIQIVGAIGIKVRPDLTGFKQELETGLARIKTDFSVNVGADTTKASAEMDAWKARQEHDPITKPLEVDRSSIDRATNAISSFSATVLRSVSKAAVGVAALTAGFNILSQVGALLINAVGVVGLIPGAVAAAGLALATVKLGMDGIKSAFSAATPALAALKTAVSDTFRKELIPGVQAAQAILPQLATGFSKLATSLSGIANSVLIAFKTSGISTFNSLIGVTSTAFSNLGKAVAPLALAFLNIANIGATMFAPMTVGAGTAAQKILDFTTSAAGIQKIQGWIQGGIDAFKALFQILTTLFDILKTVVSAFASVGTGLGQGLLGPLQVLDSFLKSSQGSAILKQLGETFKAVSGIVTGVFTAALQAIGPAIGPALVAFQALVQQIASFLIPALQIAGPVLQAVFGFLANNMGWIAPLVAGLLAAAKAFQLITTAAIALDIALNANIVGVIIAIIAAVVTLAILIVQHWTQIKAFVISVWTAIVSFLTTVWTAIITIATTIWTAISDFFIGLWNSITGFLTGVWNAILGFLTGVWNAIASAAISIWTGYVAVVTAVVDAVGSFITTVWNGVMSFLIGVWDAISGAAIAVWTGISDFFTGIVNGIVSFFTGAWNGLMSFLGGIWRSIKDTVVTSWNDVISFFTGIPGKILSALGDLGGLLVKAGEAILNGLLTGLKNIWKSITDFVGGIGKWISDHKGPLSYDKKLLVPHGNAIMDGFLGGLQDAYTPVQKFIKGIGSDLQDTLTSPSGFGGSVQASVTQSGSVMLQAGNSLEEKITGALSNWEVRLDARGVGTLAQKGSSLNATR